MKKIKAVIFDFDGTIADTIDALKHGINLTMHALGYPESTNEDVLRNINNGARELIRRSLPQELQKDEEKVTEVLALYRQMYDKVYMETKTAYEGIPELFTELHRRGYLLAILSNKPDAYMPPLAEALLPNGTYKIARGQRPGVAAKPDPACVFTLTDELGVSPCECALVGDSNVDMITAKNAGLMAVGVSWGYRSVEILKEAGADVIVHHPLDLLDLFE